MKQSYTVYPFGEGVPKNVILPNQTHSTNIVEIKTGDEDLSNTDGLWARKGRGFVLGVRTADCAPLVFIDHEKYGVIHAGWRGLVDGIVEKMLKEFDSKTLSVSIGPLYPCFEIQRDTCFAQIEQKFSSKFFLEQEKSLYFDFKSAIRSLVPMAVFDERSTYTDTSLASWRRDQDDRRNITTVIGL